jgi:hypothetical protein
MKAAAACALAGQADETAEFTFEDVEYSLDLSSGNAGKLRGHMQPWLDAACSHEITEKPAERGL